MFGGNHAKVLVYYMELGNFRIVRVDELGDDGTESALLVVPRQTRKNNSWKTTMRNFRSRFGQHFKALGYDDFHDFDTTAKWTIDEETFRVAYELRGRACPPST